jgi:hypothetical protein
VLLQQKEISAAKIEKSIKPATVGDYNRHMGYAHKSDRMSNSYSISCWASKQIKKKTVLPFTGSDDSEQFHPVVQNCHIKTSISPLCATCWNMLQGVALIHNSPQVDPSSRGGQSTSLANLLSQENELFCLFCMWEEEKHPHHVREM